LFKINSARDPIRNNYSDVFNLTLHMGKSKKNKVLAMNAYG